MKGKYLTTIFLRIAFCLTAFQAFKANADSWTLSAPNTYPNATYEAYNRMVEGSQAGYGYHAYYIDVPEGYVANVTIEYVSSAMAACQRGDTRVLVNGSSLSPTSAGGYTATLKHSSLGGYGRVEIYANALWPYDRVVRYVYDWIYNIKVVFQKVAVTTFQVTFNGNGGTPATQTRDVKAGYDIGSLPTVTRAGYTFAGWWTQAAGGSQVAPTDIPLRNITLYAHWIANTSSITAITITGDDEVASEESALYKCYGITSDGGQIEIVPTWSLTSSYATISSSGLLSALRTYIRQLVSIQATYSNGCKTFSATKSVLITPVKPICKIDSNGVLTDVDMNGCSSIYFDSAVKSIGDGVFFGCTGLTQSVSISYGITNVGVMAFACSAIPNVILSYSVERIGDYAFADCKRLTSFNVQEGVKEIGEGILAYCSSLTSLTVSTNNPCFYSTNNLLVAIDGNSVLQYAVGRSGPCTIPSGVEKIGPAAFCGASNMTEINLPSSIKEIGGDAFNSCSSISMLSLPQNLERIGDYAFAGCSGISEMRIPEFVSHIGEGAFFGCTNLVHVYFEGHAPTNVVTAESLGLPNNCKLFIRKGASGWGMNVPGEWNGLQIRYEEGQIIKPAAPIVTVSGNSLSWSTVPGAEYYKVYRSANPFAEPESYSEWLSSNGCNIEVPENNDQVYFYFVKASIDGTDATASPFSKTEVATSLPDANDSYLKIPEHPTYSGRNQYSEFHLYGSGEIKGNGWMRGDVVCRVEAESSETVMLRQTSGDSDISPWFLGTYYLGGANSNRTFKVVSGNYTFFEILASANTSPDPREFSFICDIPQGTYTLWSADSKMKYWYHRPHYIYQAGIDDFEIKGLSTKQIGAEVGVHCIDVTATPLDLEWHVEISADWITPYCGRKSAGPGTFAFVAAENTSKSRRTALIVFTCGDFKKTVEVWQSEADYPDLAPYKPEGWSAPVVVGNSKNCTTDLALATTDTDLYVSWAAINYGWDVESVFRTSIRLDGKAIKTYQTKYLYEWYYTHASFSIGKLSAGTHIITLDIDCYDEIDESNEGNNTYKKIFTVAPAVVPTIDGDDGAVVTGDAENGFVVKPSEGKKSVVVTIPDGVVADKVTVEVGTDVQTVSANGANVKVVKDGHDITEHLDIPSPINGVVAIGSATVKESVVRETLDVANGAEIDITPASPTLTTAETKPGLTYTLREGTTLGGMVDGDSKVGDGAKWTPNITVKGGTSGFYTIKVEK